MPKFGVYWRSLLVIFLPLVGWLIDVAAAFAVDHFESCGTKGRRCRASRSYDSSSARFQSPNHWRRRAFVSAPSHPLLHQTSLSSSSDLSREEISRYSRHLVLSDVGMAGQKALKDAAILVVGAGGLGSPCLLYLAAAGVGHVGIVDADTVDESNLQRQVIHGTSTVGVSKCESSRRRLHDINPHVNIRLYQEEFTSATALRILEGGFHDDIPYDVVVDGSDNFPTKYLINDSCAIVGVPWVYSAILAFEGQLSVFNFRNDDDDSLGPDYRDLLPTPPPPGDVPSCAEGGVLGVLPGTMGCLQATETIKLLLLKARTAERHADLDGAAANGEMDDNISNSVRTSNQASIDICSGRVLVFDAMKMKFREVGLAPTVGKEPITELIDYQGFCGGPQQQQQQAPPPTTSKAKTGTSGGRTMDEVESGTNDLANNEGEGPTFHNIPPKDALDKLVLGWSPWVLDVRLPTENDIVALPFTDRVSPHRTVRVKDVPPSGDVLVYCKAGVRGKKACHKLIEQGVEPERLYNLDGGILRWQKDVDPSMPRY